MKRVYEVTQQEQLLQGVAMTKSISCPNQDFNVQNIIISEQDESEPYHPNSVSFQYSSNQTQDIHSVKLDLFSVHNNLKQTFKPKSQYGKYENIYPCSAINKRVNTGKTLKTVRQLDHKLAEMHFTGIFEKSSSFVEQANQIILTEEYFRLKAYERELLAIIKQMQFTFLQFQKQKKSLISQIHCLKMDNQHLNETVNTLYSIIDDIYTISDKQFRINKQFNEENSQKITNVPFARTFYHSLDQLLQDNVKYEDYPSISIQQFGSFLEKINKSIEDYDEDHLHSLKETNFIKKISSQSAIHSQIEKLVKNITHFQEIKPLNKSLIQKNISFEQPKMKIIDIFLHSISQNRQKLSTAINNHQHKDLYFWYVIHSELVTFLGILANQTKNLSLEVSFGDHTHIWMKIFLDQLKQLKAKSKVNLSQDHIRYFNRIQQLIKDVNDLTIYRMLRNNT